MPTDAVLVLEQQPGCDPKRIPYRCTPCVYNKDQAQDTFEAGNNGMSENQPWLTRFCHSTVKNQIDIWNRALS
jgi:hypothetical protein